MLRFVLLHAPGTDAVGILLKDLKHLHPVDLHLLAPAIIFSFTAKFRTALLAFFNAHFSGSW
jgi:hypothetical protein